MSHVIEKAVLEDERVWLESLLANARAELPFYRDHLSGADASNLSSLPSFHKQTTAGYGRFPLSVAAPRSAPGSGDLGHHGQPNVRRFQPRRLGSGRRLARTRRRLGRADY